MKKTTKLLSLLCAVAAVIMMIPMQLAVGAEVPAKGTTYDLYNGFGTAAEYGPYSFYTGAANPGGVPDMGGKIDFSKFTKLTTVKTFTAGWPTESFYLTEEQAASTEANTKIEHFFKINGQICSTVTQGKTNIIVFTAPICGTYSYNFNIHTWDSDRNMEMSVKLPGDWDWGDAANVAHNGGIVNAKRQGISMQKGQTI